MANIFELADNKKSASGIEFEFTRTEQVTDAEGKPILDEKSEPQTIEKGTGVFLSFRPLRFDDMPIVAPFVNLKNAGNMTQAQQQLMITATRQMIDAGVVVGWRNVTAKFYEEISRTPQPFPPDELIDFEPTDDIRSKLSQSQIHEMQKQRVHALADDMNFGIFILMGELNAISQRTAQKKT